MESKLVYESIPNFDRRVIELAIKNDEVEILRLAALSAAMNSGDGPWAESICYELAAHPDDNVRGNALLSLGHIARIFGTLDRGRAIRTLRLSLQDPNEFVRGQAYDGLEDVKWFIKRDGTSRFTDLFFNTQCNSHLSPSHTSPRVLCLSLASADCHSRRLLGGGIFTGLSVC